MKNSLSKEEFIRQFSPEHQNRYCVQGKDKCFTGTAPTLAQVNEKYGYVTAITWLEGQLRDLNKQLGIREQMSTNDINNCASVIFERHSSLKVTELMFFFRGMKIGDYGELYGYVNTSKVLKALKEFYTARSNELSRIYEKKEQEEKAKKNRKRKETGLMAAEEYRNFLYDCKENYEDGAQRIREYLIMHGVTVTDGEHPHGRHPTLEECDPDRLIQLAEERERIMKEVANEQLLKKVPKA